MGFTALIKDRRYLYVVLAILSFVAGLAFLVILRQSDLQLATQSKPALYGILLVQELALIGIPALLLSLRSQGQRAIFKAWWRPVDSLHIGLTSLAAVSYSLAGVLVVSLWLYLLTSLNVKVPLEESWLNPSSWQEYPIALLSAAVVPALCEELMFRGLLYDLFDRRWGSRAAMIITSLLFALLHLSVQGFASLLLIGLFLVALRMRFGSLWPSVIFHGLYNVAVVVLNALGAQPSLQMVLICTAVFILCARFLMGRRATKETP